MSPHKPSQILDWVMQDKIPSNLNLTGQVLKAAGQSPRKIANPRLKLATSLIVAIAALILLSSVVYAVFRLVIDPGLQSVQDAGLVTNLGATAQPTLLPTETPLVPPSALIVDQSQTEEGVSMTLDWVYLDNTRLLLGIHYSELPAGIAVGFPSVTLNGREPGEGQQESKFLHSTHTRAIYLSNQVTQPDRLAGPVALEMSIPLMRREQGIDTQAVIFHFALPDVPVHTGQTLGFQHTRAVSVNGVEMQLRSVRLAPSAAEAVVCPSPSGAAAFSIQQATLSGDGFSRRQLTSLQPVEDQGAACQKIGFDPQGIEGNRSLTLTVNQDWAFYIDPPTEEHIPGVKALPPPPAPEPVAAQSINEVSMTLDWVFVDAKRIAFGYTISGFPEVPEASILGGAINVSDSLGSQYSSSYGGRNTLERDNEQPGTIHGDWSVTLREPLAAEEITLNIDITLDGSYGTDWNHMIGSINPTSDPFYQVNSDQWIVIPAGLVGTYHFEATSKVYPLTSLTPRQVVAANAVQMELLQAQLTPSTSSFVLCYNKPSPEDWMISAEATLLSGIEQASIGGYALLRDPEFVMKNPVELPPISLGEENVRCAQVDFALGHSNQARTITLTIPALERSAPEIFPQAELDAAYAKLKEQGIEMTLTITQGVGGGGGAWQYTKLPDGMSEEEAYERFIDALGYRTPGPWVFTIPYRP